MRQVQQTIEISTDGQGLYEFTGAARGLVAESGMRVGQLTAYCRHTSASLLIQENADPDVARDLAEFFARVAPEHMDWLRHTIEGPDDMPAHIRAALTSVSVTVPVAGGTPVLGTWQGLYLFEHRRRAHRRQVFLHLIGE